MTDSARWFPTRRRSAVAIALLTAVQACGARPPGSASSTDQDPQVLGLVVDTLVGRMRADRLVLSGMTWRPAEGVVASIRDRAVALPGITPSLLAAFGEQGAVQSVVVPPPEAGFEITVVNEGALDPRPNEAARDYWARFYEEFPGATGWARTTGVVFGDDRASTIVAVEVQCGIMCGWGVMYHLLRVSGGWRVEAEVILWVN